MFDRSFWMMFSVLMVLLILGFLFVIFSLKGKQKRQFDFHMFFVMGLLWIVLGFVMNNYVLSFIGIVCSVIGLYHKDRWKDNRKSFERLIKKQRIFMIVGLAVLLILLVLGFILFFTFNSNQEKLIGGDKDEHGCLIGTGYSYCPSTGECQRMWEEYCEEYKEVYRGN